MLGKALNAILRLRPAEEDMKMSYDTNETNPRGTRANPKPTNWKVWGPRLLKTVFRIVWVIDQALRLIAWLTGDPPS